MSGVRLLRSEAYRRTRWKNGGGETSEIAVSPAGAALDAFDWRISVGHVASDGPFSSFAGIDRTIAVLSGAGMRLKVGDAMPVTIDEASLPYEFDGDISTSAVLVGGPVTDLNVMSRRSRYSHRMARRKLNGTFILALDADIIAVLPQGGDVDILLDEAPTRLAGGDTALLECSTMPKTVERMEVRPLGAGVDLFVIGLHRRNA